MRGDTKDRSVKDIYSCIVPGVTSPNADLFHRIKVYERSDIFFALFDVGAGSIFNESGGSVFSDERIQTSRVQE